MRDTHLVLAPATDDLEFRSGQRRDTTRSDYLPALGSSSNVDVDPNSYQEVADNTVLPNGSPTAPSSETGGS